MTKVMLANEYSKHSAVFRRNNSKDDVARSYIVQPKHDGVFCALFPGAAYTRTMETLRSVDHLVLDVALPGLVLFGELWAEGMDFATISGLARRHYHSPELGIKVFDAVTMDEFDAGKTDVPYILRRDRYRNLLAPQRMANDYAGTFDAETLETKARVLSESVGYDGLILRDPAAGWFAGRSKDGEIIKVKPTIRLSLRVVNMDVVRQPTKLGGYITVRLPGGAQCDVGSGLTQEILKDSPLNIIGKIAEVEAMGYTNTGSLREPRFKGWRDDLVVADGE